MRQEALYTANAAGFKQHGLFFLALAGLVLCGSLVAPLVKSDIDPLASLLTGIIVSALILFGWRMSPRQYEVHQDRLRITNGFGRGWDVPFASIKEIVEPRGLRRYISVGPKTATWTVTVLLKRSGYMGLNDVPLSPEDSSHFVDKLRLALVEHQARRGDAEQHSP